MLQRWFLVFKRFIKNIIDCNGTLEVKQKKNLSKRVIEAPVECHSLSIIGIANSVELFKGELAKSAKSGKGNLLKSNQLLRKNEVKLLFEPYTREQLQIILTNLYKDHLNSNGYA